ncbi:MAG: peptidoglycan DD-metalloendopeptidase family protein [Candidatus Kerfeldbacteria bacterium]|nr:peptidoglycan DD-metalloendopeptidase family protein [Candidatus Kerfeldbacteria bacterium]
MKNTFSSPLNLAFFRRTFIPSLAVFLMFGALIPAVLAEDKNAQTLEEILEENTTGESDEDAKPVDPEEKERIEDEISDINEQIEEKQKELEDLQKEIESYDNAIKVKQQEEASLNNQISILDDQIAQRELDIKRSNEQIDVYTLEIRDLEGEITIKEEEIAGEKEELGAMLRRLDKFGRKTNLELVVGNDSFSDFYAQQQYVTNLGDDTREQLQRIAALKASLEEEKRKTEDKKKSVEAEKKRVEDQRLALENTQEVKEYYLEETKNSEEKFKDLVDKFRAEHLESERVISGLQQEAQKRLAELEGTEDEITFSSSNFIWPVYPAKGISCGWHCPGYPYEKLIGPHNALDIPTAQGTAVKAAADGVVSIAKRGVGSGYSYILIVHPDGFSTVYGHLSEISVSPDQVVHQGEVIGLSGGRPGFPGAGLSTGPHLHFGIRVNGIPVDPAQYMDMNIVPE